MSRRKRYRPGLLGIGSALHPATYGMGVCRLDDAPALVDYLPAEGEPCPYHPAPVCPLPEVDPNEP